MNQVREVGKGRFGVDNELNATYVVTHRVHPLPFVKYNEAGKRALAGLPKGCRDNETPCGVVPGQDLEENSETSVHSVWARANFGAKKMIY